MTKKVNCSHILSLLLLSTVLTAVFLGSCTGGDLSNIYSNSSATEKSSDISTSEYDISGKGSTYYISSSQGSDNNTGLSEDSPWKTLEKASNTSYSPGDSLLFKSGDSFDGTLCLTGSGSAVSPIKVSSYGNGGKPVLNGNGIERNRELYADEFSDITGTVELIEGSFWDISGLEITNKKNQDGAFLAGILVLDDCQSAEEYKTTPQSGIKITDCNIHDVLSDDSEKRTGGIIIMGNYTDILIDGNRIANTCVTAIRNVSWNSHVFGSPNVSHLKNYRISNNIITNIAGDCIVMDAVENGFIEYNYVNGYCTGDPQKDYAALWTWSCKNVTIQYNEVTGGQHTENDGTPFDVDYYNINTLVQYNYTHNNDKGIALFPINSTGTVFRCNVSINDGQSGESTLFSYQCESDYDAPLIYNNIVYQNPGLSTTKLFNNYMDLNSLYVKLYNNILILSDGMRLTEENNISGGTIDGNIFVPSNILNTSTEKLSNGIYKAGNSQISRSAVLTAEIPLGDEPQGLITNRNTFDTSPLKKLFGGIGTIFDSSENISSSLSTDIPALPESISPETDFFLQK